MVRVRFTIRVRVSVGFRVRVRVRGLAFVIAGPNHCTCIAS